MSHVEVSCCPEAIFLERGIFQQSVNFEFICRNLSESSCLLVDILAKALDKSGNCFLRYSVDTRGVVPSISMVPERKLEPRKTLEIMNPIANFPLEYVFERLDYRLRFIDEKESLLKSEISVRPTLYQQKVVLDLPFEGTCIVEDGHDFLSHHRRIALTHPFALKIGLTALSTRYAYDFMSVDPRGNMYKNDGSRNEDYFGWGRAVLCPGNGTIVSANHDMPDNTLGKPSFFDSELWYKDSERAFKLSPGNHVLINHGNNEYSFVVHMQKDSVKAEVGDRVERGDILGKMGNSGDSYYPHIHYELRNGVDERTSEGLPSRFRKFDLKLFGSAKTVLNIGPDTGMIITHELERHH